MTTHGAQQPSGEPDITRLFTALTAWSAEGARVGLVSCRSCGAAILLGGQLSVDTLALHVEWHAALRDQA